MIVTTTHLIENHTIIEYKGLVFGEVVAGANIIRDFFANIRDIVGGRSKAYEEKLIESRQVALQELQNNAIKLGANAVVGVEITYQSMGGNKGMFIVVASGTAVVIN